MLTPILQTGVGAGKILSASQRHYSRWTPPRLSRNRSPIDIRSDGKLH